jgi:hypothetical protein
MELLSGHEKIITKSRISPNAGTLNRGFTEQYFWCHVLGGVVETTKNGGKLLRNCTLKLFDTFGLRNTIP